MEPPLELPSSSSPIFPPGGEDMPDVGGNGGGGFFPKINSSHSHPNGDTEGVTEVNLTELLSVRPLTSTAEEKLRLQGAKKFQVKKISAPTPTNNNQFNYLGSAENLALSSVPVPNLNRSFPHQKQTGSRFFFPDSSYLPKDHEKDKVRSSSSETVSKLKSPKYSFQNFQPALPAFSPPGSARSLLFTNSASRRATQHNADASEITRPSTRALSIVSIDEQARIDDDQNSLYGDNFDDRSETSRSARKPSLADRRNQFRSRKQNPDPIKRSFDSENAIRLSTDEIVNDTQFRALSPHIESPENAHSITASKIKSSDSIIRDTRSPTRLTPHFVLPPIGTFRDSSETRNSKVTQIDETKIEKLVKNDDLKDKLKNTSKPAEFFPDDPGNIFGMVLENKDKTKQTVEQTKNEMEKIDEKSLVDEIISASKRPSFDEKQNKNDSKPNNESIISKSKDADNSPEILTKLETTDDSVIALITDTKEDQINNDEIQEIDKTDEEDLKSRNTEARQRISVKTNSTANARKETENKPKNTSPSTNQNQGAEKKISPNQKPGSDSHASTNHNLKVEKKLSTNQNPEAEKKLSTNQNQGTEKKLSTNQNQGAEKKTSTNQKKTSEAKNLANEIEAVPEFVREVSKSAANAAEKVMSEKEKAQIEIAQNFNMARQKSNLSQQNNSKNKVTAQNTVKEKSNVTAASNERPKAAIAKGKVGTNNPNSNGEKLKPANSNTGTPKMPQKQASINVKNNNQKVTVISRNPSISKIESKTSKTSVNAVASGTKTQLDVENITPKISSTSKQKSPLSEKASGSFPENKNDAESKNTVSYRFDGANKSAAEKNDVISDDAKNAGEKPANYERTDENGIVDSRLAEFSQQNTTKIVTETKEKTIEIVCTETDMPKNVPIVTPKQSEKLPENRKNSPSNEKPSLTIKNAMDSISRDRLVDSQAAFQSEIRDISAINTAPQMPSRKLDLSKTSIVSNKSTASSKNSVPSKQQTANAMKKLSINSKPQNAPNATKPKKKDSNAKLKKTQSNSEPKDLINDDVISNDIKGVEREKTRVDDFYKESGPNNTALVSGKGWHISVTLKDPPNQDLSDNQIPDIEENREKLDQNPIRNEHTDGQSECKLMTNSHRDSITSSALLSREENNELCLLLGNTLLENNHQQNSSENEKKSPGTEFSDTDTIANERQADMNFFQDLDNLTREDYIRPLTGDSFKELRPITVLSERQVSFADDTSPRDADDVAPHDAGITDANKAGPSSFGATGTHHGVLSEQYRSVHIENQPETEVFNNDRGLNVIQEESWAFTSHSSSSNNSYRSSANSTVTPTPRDNSSESLSRPSNQNDSQSGSNSNGHYNYAFHKGGSPTGRLVYWKKGNKLGHGAFGTVWQGLTSSGQLIAVKQINVVVENESHAQEEHVKLQEEVNMLKNLKHKNIVKYIGTTIDDHMLNIFMEYIPGGTIAGILKTFGTLEERVIGAYTWQLVNAVDYLHQNEVVHRDIKGSNLMLMSDGTIKLIDFGCAKKMAMSLSMTRSKVLKSMKGTPYWMSPEVIKEVGHGPKSDVWSVGCTVFEMATGKPPWSDMVPIAALFAIGSEDKAVPQLPDSNHSADIIHFVSSCMTRDVALRPSAERLLSAEFGFLASHRERRERKLSRFSQKGA